MKYMIENDYIYHWRMEIEAQDHNEAYRKAQELFNNDKGKLQKALDYGEWDGIEVFEGE